MKEAAAIDIEGLVKGYLRGTAWHCTFYTPAGRQRLRLSTKKKRQAERRASEIAEMIQKEDWEGLTKLDWKPKAQAGTFAIFVREEFLPKYCNWSERTRKGEESRIRILCEQFGALPLSGVTASAIKSWLAKRGAEGLSPASQNRYLAALKSIYKAAVIYGFCKMNPAAVVTMQPEEIKAKDVLDDEEFERLLSELPDYSQRIVLAAAETGMRAGEIRQLKWEDVDLVAGELRVAMAKNKEYRVVPLTQRLRVLLEQMKEEATPRPSSPVFKGVEIKKGLAAALKRAGIEKHISQHSFRHQFATRALEAGMSNFHLQKIGGWKSAMMLDRYGKVRNKALHEQMAKLNAYGNPNAVTGAKSRAAYGCGRSGTGDVGLRAKRHFEGDQRILSRSGQSLAPR
jgi:integrase